MLKKGQYSNDRLLSISHLLERYIAPISNISNWNKGIGCIKYLNMVIKYLEFAREEYCLDKYAILPNLNGDFMLIKDLSPDHNSIIESVLIDILNELSNHTTDYNVKLTSRELTVDTSNELGPIQISQEITSFFKRANESMMKKIAFKIICLCSTEDDVEKRRKLWSFAHDLHKEIGEFKVLNGINPYIYTEVDKFFFPFLLNEVTNLNSVNNLEYKLPKNQNEVFTWLNEFIQFYKDTKNWNEVRIIPNQNDVFCCSNELSIDEGIPEEIKDIFKVAGVNLQETLADRRVFILSPSHMSNQLFDSLNESMKMNVAKRAIRIFRQHDDEKHKELFKIIKQASPFNDLSEISSSNENIKDFSLSFSSNFIFLYLLHNYFSRDRPTITQSYYNGYQTYSQRQ